MLGEGEKTLAELLDCLTGKQAGDPATVAGVSTPAAPSDAKRDFIRELDDLPFPAWDLVDIARYKSVWYAHHGYFSMNLVTTRGCPFHCNWCAKPIYGQRYNVRSPESVAAEVRWLKDNFQPDHIWFADDIFGLKPGWIEVRRRDRATRRPDPVQVPAARRPDQGGRARGADARRLPRSSGWAPKAARSRSSTRWTRARRSSRSTRRPAICDAPASRSASSCSSATPARYAPDIEKTLQMVRDCRPDDIGISVSYPLPGTPFYERVQAQLGPKRNWVNSQDLDMMFQGAYVPEFYRTLYAVVHHEFRMRKAQDRLVAAARRPATLRPGHVRALASIPRHWVGLRLKRQKLGQLERVRRPESGFIPVLPA